MPQVPVAPEPPVEGTSSEVRAPATVVAAVPPLATGSVPLTCVVRLTPESAPPSVRLPLPVTVPVSVMPLTVPVLPTDVTVPEPLLLNVVQSVLVRYPLTAAVAAAMLITGVIPPLDTTGAVAVTLVTVPPPDTAAMVIAPAPLVMVMPEPAVSVDLARVPPVLLPISS